MSSAGDTWATHLASAERLCRLASCADLPQGSVHMDDALALLCAQPAHPVVAELAESWGLDGLAERLLAYCRALPAVRRGELGATRLARRLDGAVWEMGRDRRLVLGTHAVERAADMGTSTANGAAVESFVRARVGTLEQVVGRRLPEGDRTVLEDLLHTTVDFAVAVAPRLGRGENALEVFARPSPGTPASRRLLPQLRRYWPEVPGPTLVSVHLLVRYRVLDPALSAEHAGPDVVQAWRSCYPGLHRHVAEQIARHLSRRDYDATRRLRTRAARGDWRVLEAAMSEPVALPGLAA